ncbi:hypothetical protein KCP74_06440 [Salmonella enterica subsp. enterica]|nr:hypothetical protein KCP74_06440 [Salmonella enterica subsp. enterica]
MISYCIYGLSDAKLAIAAGMMNNARINQPIFAGASGVKGEQITSCADAGKM